MINLWDYSGLDQACMSDHKQESYKKSAEFLGDNVEDWGCGTGWSKRYFKNYKGIDGSLSKEVKEITDLSDYTSDVENVLMRAVLEYNENWKQILENVKKSFRNKFCLVIVTPFVKKTRVGMWHKPIKADGSYNEGKIPEIYFNKQDILDCFPEDQFKVREESIKTDGFMYGIEWILYVERR
jgi:hypothetical protein